MNKEFIAITGASSGIGKAIAQVFSDAGYNVLLLARRLERMEALNIPNSICKKLDVTDGKSFCDVITEFENNIAPITGLINCAGILKVGAYDTLKATDHDLMIDVNFKGVLNGCNAVLNFMKQRQSGTIITIGTMNYLQSPASAVYCASKDAVRSLVMSLRQAYANDRVRIGQIQTVFVKTPIRDGMDTSFFEKLESTGDVIQAEEFAKIVLFMFQQPKHINIRDLIVSPTISPI